jgi:hypothetical protein
MIAKRAGIRVSSVQGNWRAQVLQPDWVRRFKLSTDPKARRYGSD